MANIKIHWQKIQFHKRIAISVSLTSWTWGTAVFTPAALWPVYSLTSLPIGTQIQLVQIQWVDTYVFLHNNNEIWTLTITPSSWYELSWVVVNSTPVSSTPCVLSDWDVIAVRFIVPTISVTLVCWTGGTATFTPETGTSYTLSSLPVGTEIYKSTDTLYTLFDSNGDDVWTITLTASSWYNIDEVAITRWWVKTTIGITPIVLQEWDTIWVELERIVVRLGLSAIEWWNTSNNWWWEDANWNKIYSVNFYSWAWYLSYYTKSSSQNLTYYEFNLTWWESLNKISLVIDSAYELDSLVYWDVDKNVWTIDIVNYPNKHIPILYSNKFVQNWDWFTWTIVPGRTCWLVSYSDVWFSSPSDIASTLTPLITSKYSSSIYSVNSWDIPSGWGFNYFVSDWWNWVYSWLAWIVTDCSTGWGTLSWEPMIVVFYCDWTDLDFTVYDKGWNATITKWSATWYSLNENYVRGVFQNWNTNQLNYWAWYWTCWNYNCGNVCDFLDILESLAKWQY